MPLMNNKSKGKIMSIFSAIRDTITDANGTKENEAALEAHLETLSKLANSKAELFDLKIRENLRTSGTQNNQNVPIETIIQSKKKTFAHSGEGVDKIQELVSGVFQSLSTGSLVKGVEGVTSAIGTVVSNFIGGTDGDDQYEEHYVVYREGYSLCRMDYIVWKLNLKTSGLLTTKETNVVALAMVKSTADVSRCKLGTIMNMYQAQFMDEFEGGKDASTGKTTFKELSSHITEVFDFFHDPVRATRTVD